jgi:ABC-type transport system involved in multi-copper enzyme maturation permease subunit
MSTPAADSLPLPAPRATALRDFSDRISPMLVKELRQGLKSPLFTWGLIAMQIVLGIMAVVTLEDGMDRDSDYTFWWAVAGMVCLLLPARAANALRDELGGNTMDTLVLTRLSAWRITLGKWAATGALQVLGVITVLPYLIMRYFAGSVNLPMELTWLGIFLLFGLLVSAVLLGLSWLRYFLLRALIMLGVLGGALGFCSGMISGIVRRGSYALPVIYAELGTSGISLILTLVVWAAYFFLDLGASQIAPIAENRASSRRLAGVALLLITAVCTAFMPQPEEGMVMAAVVSCALWLVALQAVCEKPGDFTPVLLPFVKRGLAGRLAGRFLYPGWHSGVMFAVLLGLSCLGLMGWHFYHRMMSYPGYGSGIGYEPDYIAAMLAAVSTGMIGALVLPLVIWNLLRRMPQWNFWRWLTVALCAFFFHVAVAVVSDKTGPSAATLHLLLSSGGLMVPEVASEVARREQGYPWSNSGDYESYQRARREATVNLSGISLISLSLWIVTALVMARRQFRTTRRCEEELAAALREMKAKPEAAG